MLCEIEDRISCSPLIASVWRARSAMAGTFYSVASCNWSMVISRINESETRLTLRGPETKASVAEYSSGMDWVGIEFQLGTYMPTLPPCLLKDRMDVTLPSKSQSHFYLNSEAWEFPSFDNIETFIERLHHKKLIIQDQVVKSALENNTLSVSERTVQRAFHRAAGISRSTVFQIERARQAVIFLKQGNSAQQVVGYLGYADQAHMIRSVKHFAGVTARKISKGDVPLSLLFNTVKK